MLEFIAMPNPQPAPSNVAPPKGDRQTTATGKSAPDTAAEDTSFADMVDKDAAAKNQTSQSTDQPQNPMEEPTIGGPMDDVEVAPESELVGLTKAEPEAFAATTGEATAGITDVTTTLVDVLDIAKTPLTQGEIAAGDLAAVRSSGLSTSQSAAPMADMLVARTLLGAGNGAAPTSPLPTSTVGAGLGDSGTANAVSLQIEARSSLTATTALSPTVLVPTQLKADKSLQPQLNPKADRETRVEPRTTGKESAMPQRGVETAPPTAPKTQAASLAANPVLATFPSFIDAGMMDAEAPSLSTSATALSQSANLRGMASHPMQSYAPQVASQVAQAAIQAIPGRTEIALNPQELGRVRITITMAESGVAVSIFAERPETTDLMRRNIEDLAREFRDLGYDSAEFSFSDQAEGADTHQSDTASDDDLNTAAPTVLDPLPHIDPVVVRSGLDLKL